MRGAEKPPPLWCPHGVPVEAPTPRLEFHAERIVAKQGICKRCVEDWVQERAERTAVIVDENGKVLAAFLPA